MAREDERRQVEQAQALLNRALEARWRQWKGYVSELQAELAITQAEDAPEADLTETDAPVRRRARLDAATRKELQAVVEARRQQWQAQEEQAAREAGQPARDSEAVYAQLLAHIQNELDGTAHPAGKVLLWDAGALVTYDAALAQAGTSEADYLTVRGGAAPLGRQALLVGGAAVAAVALMIGTVVVFFGPSRPPARADADTLRVNGVVMTPWAVDTAAVGGVVDAAPELRGLLPLVWCANGRARDAAEPGATVVLTGTAAVRRFQVQPGASDLALADCGATPPRVAAKAQLVAAVTAQDLDAAVLRSLAVWGPDTDPQAIPATQMQVVLTVALPDAGGGTLILADGRRWAATRSRAVDGGTELTYLVPLSPTAQLAGWELAGGAGLPQLLALTVPAPTSRMQLLRDVLLVQIGEPQPVVREGVPTAALTLTLTLDAHAAPLTLLASDLAATAGGTPLPVTWEPPALRPGQTTQVALTVPLPAQGGLELALAAWRVRVVARDA
ncbi:hypothetical protein F8S13_22555 [Chloroflexia bacterium SDU3-3]|nr:hypothetical protein F8S13_22555 [Chloroflexia bacterium SDU3-3]